MRVIVVGAGGGLGRHAVHAALAAGHDVVAFVRDVARARLPASVETRAGDARDAAALADACAGCGAALWCVNAPFARWLDEFPPLLDAAIEAARASGARLVFPANVWVYGPGRPGDLVDERRPASPTSRRGALRAAMEAKLRASGARFAIVRLPEFYGPGVVSVPQRVFAAARARRRTLWPGDVDVDVELVFMRDGADALVAAGCADDTDGATFHVPGARTTPRRFAQAVYAAADATARITGVPPWALRVVGVVDPLARGAADIAHLWTHPILLDGAAYARRFGPAPTTPLEAGVAVTIAAGA